MITLANAPGYKIVLNEFLKDIHSGTIKPGQIHTGYYEHLSSKLTGAVNEGLGGASFGADDYRNTLKAYLEQNVYAFSAAKSLTMLEEFRSYLTDEKGDVVNFGTFKNKVEAIDATYNAAYLETEYHSAIAAAQMAEKWETLKGFKALQYTTVGDANVRPEHVILDKLIIATDDPLLDKIYPPKDWGCRCSMIPASTNAIPTDRSQVKKIAKSLDTKPYFAKHVGKEKFVFDQAHPYYKIFGSTKLHELDALKHYNMPSVERIYDMQDLPVADFLPDKEAANSWWEQVSGDKHGSFSLKSADGLNITFDNKFRVHVLEQNNEDRFRYLHKLVEIIQNPDEVWANRMKGRIQQVYIKYYEGAPMVLQAEAGEGIRAATLFEAKKDGAVNFSSIANSRKGQLKLKK